MGTSRWHDLTGGTSGEEYAANLAKQATTGADMHGEATFVAGQVVAPARILDAGCGTGRVAIRLNELGYDVTGVDLDESMLAVARREAPEQEWVRSDLASYDTADGFDLIVCAGNVIPLLAPGTLHATVANLAGLLQDPAILICGFGLDSDHLPRGCEPTSEAEFSQACEAAGLRLTERFATWEQAPYDPDSGYLVTVHQRFS